VGVKLHFDPVELGGRDHVINCVLDGQFDVVVDGKIASLKPKVEEFAEYHVEEIAGTAGRVKDTNTGNVVEKFGEECLYFELGAEKRRWGKGFVFFSR
jgi:hypothetical protein